MSESKPAFAFIDMETTGLEANLDVPLELGIVLTDLEGNSISDAKWLIWEENKEFQRGVMRGEKNEFVNAMHTKSELWYDLAHFETRSRVEVDKEVVDILSDHGVADGSLGMAGNSIGSLDRPFALAHFPLLNKAVGYRNIDISTLKELCKRRNPDLYKALEPTIGTKADATHRVLDDCYASIKEYQTYCEEFLLIAD